MKISTIICTYIYETFLTIKTALEVAQASAEKVLDTLYGIVKLSLSSVRELLDPIIKIIRSSISSLMKDLGAFWLGDFSDTKMCKNLYNCEFFRDYLLNPDSIFSKGVRGILGLEGNDRFSRVQTELHEITRDFQRFKEQICSGISLEFTISAITGLFQSFLAKVNKWLRWLRRKVDAVYRFLSDYLSTLKRLGVFDLLDQLKAMFDCILDETELCTSVESAESYYRAFTDKMKLYCTSANDWIIKPDYVKMCTGFMEGKIDELSDLSTKLENGLRLFVNPTNVHPTSDCLNLAAHITGTVDFIKTGRASSIPVYKYCKTTIGDIVTAWKGETREKKYNTFNELLSDLRFERDGIYVGRDKLSIDSDGKEFSMTVDESVDISNMSRPIVVGDNVYSSSMVLYSYLKRDEEISTYMSRYENSYSALVRLADVARAY